MAQSNSNTTSISGRKMCESPRMEAVADLRPWGVKKFAASTCQDMLGKPS